jgi:hypothetical protein
MSAPLLHQALSGTNEYVELEFFHGLGETVYLHTVLIWEQANPGAVVKVGSRLRSRPS